MTPQPTSLETKLKAEAKQLVDNINGLISAGESNTAADLAYRYIRNASVSDALARKFSVGEGLLEGYLDISSKEKHITFPQVEAIFNEYIEHLENKFGDLGAKGKNLIEEAKTAYSNKKQELAENLLYAAAEALGKCDFAAVEEKFVQASELTNTEIHKLIVKCQTKCAEQSLTAKHDVAEALAAKYLQLNQLLDYFHSKEAAT